MLSCVVPIAFGKRAAFCTVGAPLGALNESCAETLPLPLEAAERPRLADSPATDPSGAVVAMPIGTLTAAVVGTGVGVAERTADGVIEPPPPPHAASAQRARQ